MKRLPLAAPDRERGSVAVEFALLFVLVLVPLLAGALFFGRFFWHYTVAEKAAHDAARFLATASPTELKTVGPSGEAAILGAAKALAQAEISELNPSPTYPPLVYVYCDAGPCLPFPTAPLPQKVSVYVTMSVQDPFLSGLTALFSGDGNDLAIQIDATGNSYYVGN
jgi:hypothetical protein